MIGMEILYIEPIMNLGVFPALVFIFGLGACFCFLVSLCCGAESCDKATKVWGVMTAVCVGLVIILGIVGLHTEKETGRYRYEATISEDVSMTEFYEQYEVIEQRGEIWVIEDREIEDEK